MTANEQDREALRRCCNGNAEAVEFLALWSDYVNVVDDIVDEDMGQCGVRSAECGVEGEDAATSNIERQLKGAERVCEMGALALMLYSHPFYLKNLQALRQVALNCTNAYLDSVRFEKSSQAWQREWADHYRHFGSEMVIAVAGICGGWKQMRAVSEVVRVICWQSHHDKDGNVV